MVKVPESMEGLMYFTNRIIGDGQVKAWSWRPECPECHDDTLNKPKKKTGPGRNTRAKKYVCDTCGFEMPEEKVRDISTLQASYTCPHCGEEGTSEGPYKRKKFQGVKSYVVECEHCEEKIPLTKKMKKVDL